MKTLHMLLLVSLFAAAILISIFGCLGTKPSTNPRPSLLGLFLSGVGGGVSALMALSCVIAVLFSGCATAVPPAASPPVVRVIDTACKWVPVLTASTHDTDQTKREILAYERTRQSNCPAGADASVSTPRSPG